MSLTLQFCHSPIRAEQTTADLFVLPHGGLMPDRRMDAPPMQARTEFSKVGNTELSMP